MLFVENFLYLWRNTSFFLDEPHLRQEIFFIISLYSIIYIDKLLANLFRVGDIESIFNSRTIWICASCYACTVRCPMGINTSPFLPLHFEIKNYSPRKSILSFLIQ